MAEYYASKNKQDATGGATEKQGVAGCKANMNPNVA
jgi:hypothetical protein